MHAKAIELLVTAIAGAIIGMIGFAGLWYGTRQKERAHKTSESSDDHKRWLQVIRRMEDRITEVDGYDCIICFENRRNVIFNCKHLIACAQCAAKLNDCPMCRRRIMSKQTVQLYS